MTFRRGLLGRARDFNWHNAIGFWMCWPLIVIATCSTAMSYQWANNLVCSLSGSSVPPANVAPRVTETQAMSKEDFKIAGWNALCALAEQKMPGWQTITLRIPTERSPNISFQIDTGDGGRPDKRAQLVLNRDTGDEVRWEPFPSHSAGRKIRLWMRFAYTGEAGGIL
jgi:PepSY-associated transmembrane protein